jgi:hypothetical protein
MSRTLNPWAARMGSTPSAPSGYLGVVLFQGLIAIAIVDAIAIAVVIAPVTSLEECHDITSPSQVTSEANTTDTTVQVVPLQTTQMS